MSYQDTLDYLFGQLPMFQRVGPKAFKKDLNNILLLTDKLNNPQDTLKCIHVAGTNGKGTTCHMIASMLQAAGYKVGLYTSPHYRDFRERIKINGEFIEKRSVIKFVSWFQSSASEIKASFFEITVAMALDYFRNEKVDIAVIETGLGGRLDSTNVIHPLLSVITNISYDHTNFLGNTFELIATEKAGIIKEKIPVLIGRKQLKTKPVFEKIAKMRNASLSYSEDLVHLVENHDEIEAKYIGQNDVITLPDSKSPFYFENLRIALSAIRILGECSNFHVSSDQIKYGIRNLHQLTKLIGKWTIFETEPLTIGDSAHNFDALQTIIEKLSKHKKTRTHFVLGFVKDKDFSKLLQLFPKAAQYYFAKAKIPRGLDSKELKEIAGNYGLEGRSYSSVRKAYAAARSRAQENDQIFIGGSIFTLAEVL